LLVGFDLIDYLLIADRLWLSNRVLCCLGIARSISGRFVNLVAIIYEGEDFIDSIIDVSYLSWFPPACDGKKPLGEVNLTVSRLPAR
jgi:hypothetical protein